jgi:OmpA-OmpF porin, OOP family
MTKSGNTLIWCFALPLALSLATFGCVSKKYVATQVAPVNQKVVALEKHTNEKVAYLNNKEESDISQVNERITTVDQRVTQVAEATKQAQGTASRAMDQAEEQSGKIQENAAAISSLGSGVANALNFQLVDKADITFGFNKSTLTPQAKQVLDQIAAKAQSLPRNVVELAGFTDPRGSANYNLALSRRRAWAVQRYLISQKVATASIHVVGMGEEAPGPGLEADLPANASKAERDRLARRVQIRLFGAGDITGTASRERQ